MASSGISLGSPPSLVLLRPSVSMTPSLVLSPTNRHYPLCLHDVSFSLVDYLHGDLLTFPSSQSIETWTPIPSHIVEPALFDALGKLFFLPSAAFLFSFGELGGCCPLLIPTFLSPRWGALPWTPLGNLPLSG